MLPIVFLESTSCAEVDYDDSYSLSERSEHIIPCAAAHRGRLGLTHIQASCHQRVNNPHDSCEGNTPRN